MAITPVHQSHSRTVEEPAHLPGVCRIFSLPCECFSRIMEVYRAETLGDNEGVFEHTLRLIEMPFNATSSLFNVINLLFKGLLYFGLVKNPSAPFLQTM